MPTPESAEGGVFCEDGCHEIKPKYGMPKVKKGTGGLQANRSRRAFEVVQDGLKRSGCEAGQEFSTAG